jgi:predicted nucleic acid-binding protein
MTGIQEKKSWKIYVTSDPAELAQHVYDKMKGFRVRNTHAKTCAEKALILMLTVSDDKYANVINEAIKILKTLK